MCGKSTNHLLSTTMYKSNLNIIQRLRCLVCLLALWGFGLSAPLSAQTFYEIIFTDRQQYENYALMVYYDEENCTLNLRRHTADGDNFSFRTLNYLCQRTEEEGETPFTVMASDEDGTPTFIWIWDDEQSEEQQLIPYIELDENDSADDWIRASSCIEVEIRQLTPEYIGQYLDTESELYRQVAEAYAEVMKLDAEEAERQRQAIAQLGNGDAVAEVVTEQVLAARQGNEAAVAPPATPVPTAVCPVPTESRPTLHLFTLINNRVADIGAACATDYGNISNEMHGISQALGIPLKEYKVMGSNFSKAGLRQQLAKLSPGADDIVVFLYSGHGFRFDNQQDRYPMMALTTNDYQQLDGNYVALSDVYNEICSKNARLNIVLSDCCNSNVGERRPLQGNTLFSRGNNNFSRARLQELFFNAKGSILSTAASPGEYSWCDAAGGMFTLSFIQSLRREVSAMNQSTVDWQHVVDNTLRTALQRSSNNAEAQNGLKYVKVAKL